MGANLPIFYTFLAGGVNTCIGWKKGLLSSGRLLYIVIKLSGQWGPTRQCLSAKGQHASITHQLGYASVRPHTTNGPTHQIVPCIKPIHQVI